MYSKLGTNHLSLLGQSSQLTIDGRNCFILNMDLREQQTPVPRAEESSALGSSSCQQNSLVKGEMLKKMIVTFCPFFLSKWKLRHISQTQAQFRMNVSVEIWTVRPNRLSHCLDFVCLFRVGGSHLPFLRAWAGQQPQPHLFLSEPQP